MPQKINITRVTIPDFIPSTSVNHSRGTEDLVDESTTRIDSLQQAIDDSMGADSSGGDQNLNLDSNGHLHQSEQTSLTKIDGLIDSILAKFPLSHPVTIAFVGCTTDSETDSVANAVAQRLTQRHVGKVLLVDANPNSQKLTSDLGLANSEGIGNVICDEQPWQSLLQTANVTGLDFLPYGNVNTAKTLRSRTQNFLVDAKTDYQFICVSSGLNDSPLSKSFCIAADGIYLLVDLFRLTHLEAKAAADQILLNNLPLVGCIALDAEQEQK